MNMKRETEVKAFEVKQYCDACGEELTFTGQRLLSNPPKYVHICNKCGKRFFIENQNDYSSKYCNDCKLEIMREKDRKKKQKNK